MRPAPAVESPRPRVNSVIATPNPVLVAAAAVPILPQGLRMQPCASCAGANQAARPCLPLIASRFSTAQPPKTGSEMMSLTVTKTINASTSANPVRNAHS